MLQNNQHPLTAAPGLVMMHTKVSSLLASLSVSRQDFWPQESSSNQWSEISGATSITSRDIDAGATISTAVAVMPVVMTQRWAGLSTPMTPGSPYLAYVSEAIMPWTFVGSSLAPILMDP